FASDLAAHPGTTLQYVVGTGLVLGVSSSDYIKAFSKVVVGIKSSQLFKPDGQSPAADAPNPFSLQDLALAMQPDKTVQAQIKGNLTLPYNVSVNLPFVSVSADLNANRLVDVSVSNIVATPGKVNALDLLSVLAIHDTDSLATDVAALVSAINAKQPLAGNIGGGYLLLGVDATPSNVIDTFSKVSYAVPIKQLISSPEANATTSLAGVDMRLESVSATALPRRMINSTLSISLNSTYSVTVTGLNYISALAGVDKTPVFGFQTGGVSIAPGTNKLELQTLVVFQSGREVSSAVAELYNSVISAAAGPEHYAFGAGLSFGYSQEKEFRLFSK
ncbi:hypothetical protein HDU91_004421, partial [Kappamyces sp. JEL0680]